MNGLRRLSEVDKEDIDFLTIRTSKAWLDKGDSCQKSTLFVEIQEDPEVLRNSQERTEHFKSVDSSWFKKQLKKYKQEKTKMIRIADSDHPLEILTGDTCLVLQIEGRGYLLNFFRDIPPEGWLLPGGCPQSLEEIFNPEQVATRELLEEVLITDISRTIYSLSISQSPVESLGKERLGDYSKIVFPWMQRFFPETGDAKNLIIAMEGRERYIKANINIFVYPETGSVSVVCYRKVFLPVKFSELRLFDGEKNQKEQFINRPIRLVDLREGCVAGIFISGRNILLEDYSSFTLKQVCSFI